MLENATLQIVSEVPTAMLSSTYRSVNSQKLTSNTPPPKAKNPTKLETETLRFGCGAIVLTIVYPEGML